MSFPGRSLESRLRQANSRFFTVADNMKNMVNSLGRSLSGLLQKNYSPPPAPPTTPDLLSDDEDAIEADLAEIAMDSTISSLPSHHHSSIAASVGAIPVKGVSSDGDVDVDSSNKCRNRKTSNPIPIPKSSHFQDQPQRTDRKKRLYI